MKQHIKYIAAAVLLFSSAACKKSFLDINQNPNQVLSATPDAILPAALNRTDSLYINGYNVYGGWTVGYWAKTGTVNGYDAERTYTYTNSSYQSLWNSTYDVLNDLELLESSAASLGQTNYEAIAKIVKVFNFQLLVDEYGNIPYTNALKGQANLSPTYDKAEDIYKDLIVQLDKAIALIDAATANTIPVDATKDFIFNGDMSAWKKYANTLKLRILLRQSQVPALSAYLTTEFAKLPTAASAYITDDVTGNPGYVQSAGKLNPFWESYYKSAANNATSNSKYVRGTTYAIQQYQQSVNDNRLSRIYTKVNNVYVGVVLGDQNPLAHAKLSEFGTGIFKAYNAPAVILLAAESYFLQAEAKARGLLSGGDGKAEYQQGIRKSFAYFYKSGLNSDAATTDADAYINGNGGNKLIDWNTSVNKQETIIYQKWLALNSINSIEAWSEYRRTGYPANVPASLESVSTRPDKLPVRLLYPQTEISTNPTNVAAQGVINQFTSRIFWDID